MKHKTNLNPTMFMISEIKIKTTTKQDWVSNWWTSHGFNDFKLRLLRMFLDRIITTW